MKASCSVFSQILELIPRIDFERFVKWVFRSNVTTNSGIVTSHSEARGWRDGLPLAATHPPDTRRGSMPCKRQVTIRDWAVPTWRAPTSVQEKSQARLPMGIVVSKLSGRSPAGVTSIKMLP